MAIEMGKKYRTRDGRDVRILCVDGPHEDWPVIGLLGDEILNWKECGECGESGEDKGPTDLVEISPYSDIAIDAPGWWLSDLVGSRWEPGHFAGVYKNGKPMVWWGGQTSHTANGRPPSFPCAEFTTTKPEGL